MKHLRKIWSLSITMLISSTLYAQNAPFHAVVATDNSGDYAKVQEAIDAAPENRTEPWIIFVKNGSYREHVVIPRNKPFIHLIGQDKEKTIIHHNLNVGGAPNEKTKDATYWAHSVHNPQAEVHKYEGSVVKVKSTDFYTENISYINDWGVEAQAGPQALAMNSSGDRASFKNCIFRSFQDTWMTTTQDTARHYVKDCYIEGAVDYFYGGGDVLLENCTLYNVRRGSVIVAPCHKDAKYGYIFRDCIVDGNKAAAKDSRTTLGRPWHNAPRTIYINTRLMIPINPIGWSLMGTVPAIFAEYNSVDKEGNLVDLGKRRSEYVGRGENAPKGSCPTTITKDEADKLTYENVILNNGNTWNPREIMAQLPAPKGLKVKGNKVSWKRVKGATGYIVLAGDYVIDITTKCKADIEPGTTAIQVRAVSKYGALGAIAK